MKKTAMSVVFRGTLPVMTGYLFLGIGFGILLHEKGYGIGWAFATALFMYAGSAQYLTVSLLTSHASLISTAIAILLVNARHLFYGISLVEDYKNIGKKKPYMIFALTDETYSLVSQVQIPDGVSKIGYCFWVTLLDHCYWVSGTLLGALTGQLLPINYEGVDFALTALFVTIFVEQWLSTKRHGPAIVGVAATAASLILFGRDVFLIPSMILIAISLTMMRKNGKEEAHA